MITNLFDEGKDFKKLAVEKIDKELKAFNGDKYGKAVYTYVANVLRDFCEQNEQFAEVVYRTKRSLSDCCAEIMKGCGQHISDIEVYRRATKLYFPNSEIECIMTITITGDEPDEKYLSKESKKPTADKPKNEKKPEPKNTSKPKAEKKDAEIIQLTLF